MKKLILLILLALSTSIFAQIPDSFSYQAVVRGNDKALIKNQTVSIRSSILKEDETIFTQTQTATTNENGLLSIVIGNADFQTINWTDGQLFIKTQIDFVEGGNIYTIETETQLLAVPYAMAAKTAVNVHDLDLLIEKVNRLEEEVEELKDKLDGKCNCIMDTLKGEWIWAKKYGGYEGQTTDSEFKSIIKFLSQNEDGSINYEVFVEDTLFYKNNFQIQESMWQGIKKANIVLPHRLIEDYWNVFFYIEEIWNEETGHFEPNFSNEDLRFQDPCDDCYNYFYKKIKEK